jgi:hypothetical protein
MEFPAELLAIVIGFMVLSNRLVAALVTPIFDKYQWEKFWLMYVSWVLAGVLVFLADANLFEAYIANPLIGKVLTAVVAGGGGNLLHDLTDASDLIFFEEVKEE